MKTLTPIQSAIIDSLDNRFAPLPKNAAAELALLGQFFQGEDLTEEVKTVVSLAEAGVRMMPTNRKALSIWLLRLLGIQVVDSERNDSEVVEAIERTVVNMIAVDHKKDDREGWMYVSEVKAQVKRRKGCCHDGEFCDADFDSVISGLITSGVAETNASGKWIRMTRGSRK